MENKKALVQYKLFNTPAICTGFACVTKNNGASQFGDRM